MRTGVLLMAHGTPSSLDEMPEYLRLVRGGRPPSDELIHEMRENYAAIGGRSPLTEITEAQASALGARLGPDRAVQGNLDPTLLLGPLDRIFAATDEVLARAGGRPGHIFNLGHGILPSTPVEHVQALARYVHQKTRV